MGNKVVLMDGAAGTTLWKAADAAGIERVPVWKYNIEHPELVKQMNLQYLDAGSELIQANTFGANGPAVKGASDYEAGDVVRAAVRIAKEAVAERNSSAKIALAAGPLSQLMEPFGDLTREEVCSIYDEMLSAGIGEGADVVIFETFFDLDMMSAAAETAVKYGVPVICSMTFESHGRTMMGNSVEDVIETLSPIGISAIGMNCSLGPDMAIDIIRQFRDKTDLPLFFKPNAGLPISKGGGWDAVPYTPETFAEAVKPALEFVSYIGGCCGSDADYVKEIKKLM